MISATSTWAQDKFIRLDSTSTTKQGEPDQKKEQKKNVFENLGDILFGFISQVEQDTSVYRLHGEKTLTIGNEEAWIRAKMISSDLQRITGSISLTPYIELNNIANVSRLREINELFVFRDEIEVRGFLVEQSQLISWLEQSYIALVKHFGLDCKFVLELVKMPDENDKPHLFVYIQTILPVELAISKLDNFDNDWFLEHIHDIGDALNFNLEFI